MSIKDLYVYILFSACTFKSNLNHSMSESKIIPLYYHNTNHSLIIKYTFFLFISSKSHTQNNLEQIARTEMRIQ